MTPFGAWMIIHIFQLIASNLASEIDLGIFPTAVSTLIESFLFIPKDLKKEAKLFVT